MLRAGAMALSSVSILLVGRATGRGGRLLERAMLIAHLKLFVAGFLATLVFHQGLMAVLHAAGISPRAAWNLTAVPPLGVPQVVSLAFWGGLWAIAIALGMRVSGLSGTWVWVLAGALLPSIVALGLVMPMKGIPVDGKIVVGALLLNAAWGWGVAICLQLMTRID